VISLSSNVLVQYASFTQIATYAPILYMVYQVPAQFGTLYDATQKNKTLAARKPSFFYSVSMGIINTRYMQTNSASIHFTPQPHTAYIVCG
jgi:hypothetical protein